MVPSATLNDYLASFRHKDTKTEKPIKENITMPKISRYTYKIWRYWRWFFSDYRTIIGRFFLFFDRQNFHYWCDKKIFKIAENSATISIFYNFEWHQFWMMVKDVLNNIITELITNFTPFWLDLAEATTQKWTVGRHYPLLQRGILLKDQRNEKLWPSGRTIGLDDVRILNDRMWIWNRVIIFGWLFLAFLRLAPCEKSQKWFIDNNHVCMIATKF